MTIKKFAAMLDGRQYLHEISPTETQMAKELEYVVVFGYSDDCMELRGAIDEEIGCWGGTTVSIYGNEIIKKGEGCEKCKLFREHIKKLPCLKSIESNECFWEYEIDLPHECFDIYEGQEKYCRGIVFEIPRIDGEGKQN